MSQERNIWSLPEEGLTEEQLTAYLEGRLSDAERREVEAWLAVDGAESDALEGLEGIDTAEVQSAKARINAELRRNLSRKKKRRGAVDNQREVLTAVLIVLLLILICFGIFWRIKQHKASLSKPTVVPHAAQSAAP